MKPLVRLVLNPKLKFLDPCREVMRFKQLSHRTEETYLQWIRRYILFHRRAAPDGAHGVTRPTAGWIWRHPKEMGEVEAGDWRAESTGCGQLKAA